ncbi:MAG: GNAT family N-acetyltransferase [bacterium]|nr:GNAT family N-acetyltransferase [bacterium]
MNAWPGRYACVDLSGLSDGRYSLRPLTWDDREPIRHWRNEQIEILRQSAPLAEADQDRYYDEVIRPQMTQSHPGQVLAAFVEDDALIGYGGIVHIAWPHRRGEVSFITATDRQSPDQFSQDLSVFLRLVGSLALRLGLHRLTTETYEFRAAFVSELEAAGYVQEGRLREHVWTGDEFIDSLSHGVLLPGSDIRG